MGETVEQGRVDEGLLGEEDILQVGGRGEDHGGGDEVGVAYGLKIVSLHYAVAVTHVYFHYTALLWLDTAFCARSTASCAWNQT